MTDTAVVLGTAISALQAIINQQLEAAKATQELLNRFTAIQAAGKDWAPEDVRDYFDYLQARDDEVKAGAV